MWGPLSLLSNRYRHALPGVERVKRPRLRMSGAIPLLPHVPSWKGENFTLFT
jgi:hypothetical protein